MSIKIDCHPDHLAGIPRSSKAKVGREATAILLWFVGAEVLRSYLGLVPHARCPGELLDRGLNMCDERHPELARAWHRTTGRVFDKCKCRECR